ncbi:MAG: hypothetical protein H8E46_10145 [FCB group bacterium]|nr:hypothetical protein [FCB group bacterium]
MPEKVLDQSVIETEYQKNKPLYDKLGKKVKDALIKFLKDEKIDYFDVTSRTKTWKRFWEKVSSKLYKKPFQECEDICGCRIIHFYDSDTKKIEELIKKEFNAKKVEPLEGEADPERFAYRRNHYIAKIKDEWLCTPDYEDFRDLKVEIQIRTMAFHAWAEIEHKLSYSSKDQIPFEIRRKFSQLCALFEIADEKFDDVRRERTKYSREITKTLQKDESVEDIPVNLDSFIALANFHFPDLPADLYDLSGLWNKIIGSTIDSKEIIVCIINLKPHLSKARALHQRHYNRFEWDQASVICVALDTFSDTFWDSRKNSIQSKWIEYITEMREELRDK